MEIVCTTTKSHVHLKQTVWDVKEPSRCSFSTPRKTLQSPWQSLHRVPQELQEDPPVLWLIYSRHQQQQQQQHHMGRFPDWLVHVNVSVNKNTFDSTRTWKLTDLLKRCTFWGACIFVTLQAYFSRGKKWFAIIVIWQQITCLKAIKPPHLWAEVRRGHQK